MSHISEAVIDEYGGETMIYWQNDDPFSQFLA
jgi:hypothetical protein